MGSASSVSSNSAAMGIPRVSAEAHASGLSSSRGLSDVAIAQMPQVSFYSKFLIEFMTYFP
jgi:hypothetical protein